MHETAIAEMLRVVHFLYGCESWTISKTSCARGDTIWLRPCKLTISLYLFARWHLFRHVGYLRHQQQVDVLNYYAIPLVCLRPIRRNMGNVVLTANDA